MLVCLVVLPLKRISESLVVGGNTVLAFFIAFKSKKVCFDIKTFCKILKGQKMRGTFQQMTHVSNSV